MRTARRALALLLPILVLGACGDDGAADGASGDDDRPRVVVTTSILGDVVSSLLGDAAEVTTIMPPGVNPHDFQASPREAAAMREADLLVVNGGGFEEGLLEVVAGAEDDGVPVFEALSAVEHLDLEEHEEEDGDDHGHEHEGADPHFFADPARMADAARGILDAVSEELDLAGVEERAAAYLEELEALDAEVESILAAVPADRRVLVTNHEVFGYFADRYGFEVVGTVIPGGSTGESAAGDLADLLEVIEEEGVPAIFADTSSPADLAANLAGDVGDVEVVELFSESLGDEGSGGESYVAMVRTNAERIAAALA
jgi:zinc/manganese transport system substrate-binding protein